MDKLRALQYFVTAAEDHSFTRAARRLDVSVPAVAKLVNTLERELGAQLFDRSAQGLKLTAGGERYLDACQPLLAQLAAADEGISEEALRPRGTLTLGAHPQLAKSIMPALPRFHARFPDLQIDIRVVNRINEINDTAAEVFLVQGWPELADMVRRVIAQPCFLTCAAPGYWAMNGVPQRPSDIERHVCMLYCNDQGTVNDLWQYERSAEKESVTARGWLVSNHRDIMLDAVLAGEGVGRIADLTAGAYLRSGQLVPVLLDWKMSDAAPINLLYPSSQRRNPRVRLFMEFVIEVFRALEAESGTGASGTSPDANGRPYAERPYWHGRQYRRASAAARKRD